MMIYVTNRKICIGDFLERIEMLAKRIPHAIMLREKDLHGPEYEYLASAVRDICGRCGVSLIVNQEIEAALKLGIPRIHLSMEDLRENRERLSCFSQVGASVHSAAEAAEAEELGASYIIAGHIYPTDCKKGVTPRGLDFLREVCSSVNIPVFAIGGITAGRVEEVRSAGASGACIMSEAMTCHK
jgi:thiamine-phosphate pyrophosphorylase